MRNKFRTVKNVIHTHTHTAVLIVSSLFRAYSSAPRKQFYKQGQPGGGLAGVIFALACASFGVRADTGDDSAPGYLYGVSDDDERVSSSGKAEVTDEESNYSEVYGGLSSITSGSNNAEANENTVNISAGLVEYFVYGGNAYSSVSNAEANENKVTISGGTSGSVRGGYAYYYGADATANLNEVEISGEAKVSSDVIGGYVSAQRASGGYANGNTVTISDNAEIGGSVYGGYAYIGYRVADNPSLQATGNNIIVEGGTISGDIYGGYGADMTGSLITNLPADFLPIIPSPSHQIQPFKAQTQPTISTRWPLVQMGSAPLTSALIKPASITLRRL